MDHLEEAHYFTSPIYMVKKEEYLEPVREVSNRYLADSKIHTAQNGQIVTMTTNYSHEPALREFGQYVSQTAFNILASQGYGMETLVTVMTEMWTQEHSKYSSMDIHTHGMGAQISCFYFIDTPADGNKLVIHDPRSAKTIINLPEKDDNIVTPASKYAVFNAEAGIMVFINAWLPHSFTRNMSDEPFRFVHMNLSVALAPRPEVEIL
jgi:uncharacterized protein (TIGR02466 family)